MQKTLFFILTSLIFASCGSKSSVVQKQEDKEQVETQELATEDTEEVQVDHSDFEYYGRSLKNTIGFVMFNMDEEHDEDELITILNDDQSIWLEIRTGDLDQISSVLSHDNDFKPWLVLFEVYRKVDFRCVSQDDDYYYIAVNDRANVVKRLKKGSNPIFKSVEEYLQTMIVDSDAATNPMREGPGEDYPKANFPQTDLHACMDAMNGKEVSGEWMKIQDVGNENVSGWVRWRKDDTLLLSLWYIL